MTSPAAYVRRLFTPWRWRSAALSHNQKHPFDRTHGVDTGGLLYPRQLSRGHPHDLHSAGYYATAPSLFHGAIDLWRGTLHGTGFSLVDYTLVDIGCGKGRVLMLASLYEFREIVGVELNPGLARIARKNLRKWMIRTSLPAPARIIEADALAVPIPDGPVALFYFNSFERELTEKWLSRLAALAGNRTAPVDLIYIHPEFDTLVRQVSGMRSLAQADIPFTDDDAAADVFGVNEDRCVVYRLG